MLHSHTTGGTDSSATVVPVLQPGRPRLPVPGSSQGRCALYADSTYQWFLYHNQLLGTRGPCRAHPSTPAAQRPGSKRPREGQRLAQGTQQICGASTRAGEGVPPFPLAAAETSPHSLGRSPERTFRMDNDRHGDGTKVSEPAAQVPEFLRPPGDGLQMPHERGFPGQYCPLWG